jgi:RNA polymerase sigma factor (sigma-70 family)
MTDWELLRQYRENHSNEAFRKLADRHMKLVYSTCRRDLDNAQAAEDATQLVFILLARKAGAISPNGSVSSWLFGAARFVCKDMIKSEMRRRRREEAAFDMEQMKTGNTDWDQIELQINDALTSLTRADREAVLMRYYDGMSLQEIAGQIGTTEDSARKRVARAVDRLRRYFQREQATAQLLSLDSLLLAYASHAVPAQTHTAVMSTLQNLGAAHGAAAALNSHAGVLLKKGAIVLMDATTKKILAGVAVAFLIGAFIAVPKIVAHARYEQLIAQDTANLIDAAQASQSGSASAATAADRAQIVAKLQENLDDIRQRSLSHWNDYNAPDLAISMAGNSKISVTTAQQQDRQLFDMLGPFNATDTVQSVQIKGSRAYVTLDAHVDGTTVKYKQIPAGLRMDYDETIATIWEKRNGEWLDINGKVLTMRLAFNGSVVSQLPKANGSAAASP